MEWFDTQEELPPKDGIYYVCDLEYGWDAGIAFYDGWGFKFEGSYHQPKYWAFVPDSAKKYGKVKK
jgi:hypothetical protein